MPASADEIRWDPARGELDPAALGDPDVLVNLAGANIGRPWTPTYRNIIRESRVSTTGTLAAVAAQLERRPVVITQSGVGGYGSTAATASSPRTPNSARVSSPTSYASGKAPSNPPAPPAAASPPFAPGWSWIARRPAFQLLSLPFRLGLGGRLGPGTQYFPVVSLTDWVRAVRFVAEHDTLSGPVNVTLPVPATNNEFTQALATALHRPAFVPVPAFLMKAVLGEFTWELVGSKRAIPTRLQSHDFTFHHPTIPAALSAALSS